MRLAQKLKKLTEPQLLTSIRRHLGLAFLTRRPLFRIGAGRIIASIESHGFRVLHERHAVENPGDAWPKYLDLQRWIPVNLRRISAVDLDHGRRRRVLDIGAGAGYFLYICKWLGHDPVALDIDDVPMYPEMSRTLGLQRHVWRIEAFTPLPDLGEKFDVVTAFMICFNGHKSDALWGPREWDFFLDDIVTRHLKPNGRIWLEFNREPDGIFLTNELCAFFRKRGAEVEGNRVSLSYSRPPERSGAR